MAIMAGCHMYKAANRSANGIEFATKPESHLLLRARYKSLEYTTKTGKPPPSFVDDDSSFRSAMDWYGS